MLASIGVLDRRERLVSIVKDVISGAREGGRVQIEERREGPEEFVDVSGDLTPEAVEDIRSRLAQAIGDHIVSDLEPVLLEKICERTYRHLADEERASILALATRSLHEVEMPGTGRAELIAGRILDYLGDETRLNLRGFITFRLKDYLDDLEDAVDRAIDDYLLEREYAEFIRLLRYFVEAQSPRTDVVHVTVNREGAFRLFDGDHQPVDGGNLREFIVDTLDSEVAYEDFLVSALISLAPQDIVIHDRHGAGDQESITTVQNVFRERVRHCKGCRFCRMEGRA